MPKIPLNVFVYVLFKLNQLTLFGPGALLLSSFLLLQSCVLCTLRYDIRTQKDRGFMSYLMVINMLSVKRTLFLFGQRVPFKLIDIMTFVFRDSDDPR